ncbi:MAG: TolC family protein [Elusimicrobiales bacterium]
MNMRLAIVFVLTACAPAFCGGGAPLSWQDCQEAALKSNPSLASYRNARDAARFTYSAARNNLYPALSASHSYSRGGNNYGSGPADSWGANLGISQTLFNPKTYAGIAVQLKAAEQADISLHQAAVAARANLLNSFNSLIYAQTGVNVAKRIYDIRRQNADTVALQYQGGTQSKGNMMYARAQAEQARATIAQAERAVISGRRDLAKNLGMDEFSALASSGELSVPVSASGISIDDAARNVPAVMAAAKQLETARAQLDLAGSDLYPSLSANGGLNWSGQQEFPGNRAWTLGAALTWPLFSNGPTYHKNTVASARSQLEKTREDYRSAFLGAKSDLQSALAQLDNSIDSAGVSAQMLSAARQRYGESSIEYLAGTINFQNWEDVSQSLVSAEQDYLGSLLTVNKARAQLDSLLGIPLGE